MFFNFKKKEKIKFDKNMVPKHIAIIMDGNGRWAKKRGLPRAAGHRAGAQVLRTITEYADKIGVRYLTVYAFSTENWKRPKAEVDALMTLLLEYLKDAKNQLNGKNVVIKVIGDVAPLSNEIKAEIIKTEEYSKNNSGLTLNIAINYGSQNEIVNAVQKIAQQVKNGELEPSDINEKTISQNLYTKNCPDPDLIIRPSGEFRLSNFLMWQGAYSELWFSNINWPDFKKSDLDKAILDFQKRNRRFGGV